MREKGEGEMKGFRCVLMRGGTSKGVFFHENELPQDPDERKKVILRVLGSPDKRQIDGLGGADLLTSKVVIIGPPSRNDAQVDYIFGQVGITEPTIDFGTLCGNLSSAVGPFAIDEGLVRATEPFTRVKIFCPMVNRYLATEVETKNGKTKYDGDFKIDGVPGTGSRIRLDFSDTAGLLTGKILPTGKPKDTFHVEGFGEIEASVVDASFVVAFINARDLGLSGSESPQELDSNRPLIKTMENIRLAIADKCNLGTKSPLLPMLALVQKPIPWKSFVTGQTMSAEDADILSKIYGAGMMHKAYPGTGCIATGVASRIKGTLVNELLSEEQEQREQFVIGHFSGLMPMEVKGREIEGEFKLEKAIAYRTARRILEGNVYI
jgi:2-methylaconitate cis-trans-isomerase PrpF